MADLNDGDMPITQAGEGPADRASVARQGWMTYEEVRDCAIRILAAGQYPSEAKIRAALGRGNPSTILKHLRAVYTELGATFHERADASDMPAGLMEAARDLWAASVKQANARWDEHRHELARKQREMVTQLYDALSQLDDLRRDHEQLTGRLASTAEELAASTHRAQHLTRTLRRYQRLVRRHAVAQEREAASVAERHRQQIADEQARSMGQETFFSRRIAEMSVEIKAERQRSDRLSDQISADAQDRTRALDAQAREHKAEMDRTASAWKQRSDALRVEAQAARAAQHEAEVRLAAIAAESRAQQVASEAAQQAAQASIAQSESLIASLRSHISTLEASLAAAAKLQRAGRDEQVPKK